MSNVFLRSLFSEIRLPEGILSDVMVNYGFEYRNFLALNPSIGPMASQLVHDETEEQTYVALLQSGNRFALDAVLKSAPRSDDIVGDVLAHWDLSPRDQCRLVRPGVSTFFASRIMDNSEFTFGARELAAHQLGCEIEVFFDDDEDFEAVVHESRPCVFDPGNDGPVRPTSILDGFTRGEWLEVVPAAWGSVGTTKWDMAPLGDILIEKLGNASTETSRDAWANFLGLLESGTSGPVGAVADVAIRLVHAEKVHA